MHTETERIFGTLQVIFGEKLGFDLPDGQDDGYTSPFVWDASENGEFNILNLSQYKGWLKLTDADVTIRSWQQLEYLEYFPTFDYNTDVWKIITTQLQSLSDVLKNNSQVLESFCWKNYSDRTAITSPGIIVAELEDEKWICVCPTIYKETKIPEEVISRSPLVKETFTEPFTETTLNLISKVEKITTDLGKIHLVGDFGGGYYYTYDHEIVYAVAETKEGAIEKALQTSGMLEIKKFHSFYPDEQDLEDWHNCYQINKNSLEYERINQFLNQSFSEVMMYRVSFWTQENIYIIGETECGDWAGLYIESEFVYNP